MRRTMVLAFAVAGLLALAPAVIAQVTVGGPRPLASGPTNWEGVTIDLMSVERKGSVLTVKWAMRNAGTKSANVQIGLTGRSQSTYILDEESGTKYYALTDKEKNTLASEHVVHRRRHLRHRRQRRARRDRPVLGEVPRAAGGGQDDQPLLHEQRSVRGRRDHRQAVKMRALGCIFAGGPGRRLRRHRPRTTTTAGDGRARGRRHRDRQHRRGASGRRLGRPRAAGGAGHRGAERRRALERGQGHPAADVDHHAREQHDRPDRVENRNGRGRDDARRAPHAPRRADDGHRGHDPPARLRPLRFRLRADPSRRRADADRRRGGAEGVRPRGRCASKGTPTRSLPTTTT